MNIDSYPIDAFPEIIANAIRKSAFYHHVPITVAAQSFLGEMTYIAQDKINAPSDKSETGQPASLFLLTVFGSGEGKDVCKNDASRITRERESKKVKNYQLELDEWNSSSPKDRGEKPRNPRSFFKKATVQGIINVMSTGSSDSFGWVTCEGGYLFGGYSLTSETVGEAISVCNDLVDTGQANAVLRNDEDSRFFDNKRLTLDISVQDVVARPALNNILLREQGFLARALFVCAEPLPFIKLTNEAKFSKSFEDLDLKKYWHLCEKLLDKKLNSDQLSLDEKNRILIEKSDEAEQLHLQYENFINQEVEPNGKYDFIRPYAKRTNQYVLRVAAILAFWHEKVIIDQTVMKGAIDICLFSLNEWCRYYKKTEKSNSTLLLDWIVSQKTTKVLKSSILQNAPVALRKKAARDDAILHLIDTKKIRIEKIGNSDYIILNST